MRRPTLLITSLAILVSTGAVARSARAQDSPSSGGGASAKTVAPEFGAGVGVDIPTGGLGVGPGVFIEGGARFRVGPGTLSAALRIGFETFSTSGTGRLACADPPAGPCIASKGGAYEWSMNEKTVTFALPVSYRFLPPDKLITPYVGLAPQIFLLKATVTSYGLDNSEGGTKFGVLVYAGGQLKLGPGGLFLELGYQYAGLNHRITGDANIGAAVTALGYRVAI